MLNRIIGSIFQLLAICFKQNNSAKGNAMFRTTGSGRNQHQNTVKVFQRRLQRYATSSVLSLTMLCSLALAPAANAQSLDQIVADPDMLWGNEVPDGWTGDWPDELRTVAERTDFTRTQRIRDVHEYFNTLKWQSENVHVFDVYETPMGNVSSAIVLANPRVTSPEEAEASGKPVVYIQGKIHPPEPSGSEASMMVIRDILFGDKKHLLDNQIIIVLPILNVDGTERLSTRDTGPFISGKRTNSMNADLNRDGAKLVTPEIQGMYENILNAWDPVLFYDSHRMGTGNVAYGIGCSHSTVPAGHPGPRGYVWDKLFPSVIKKAREDYKIEAFTHALWSEEKWPPKTWGYDATIWAVDAKFLVNAYGLRNRLSVLCESPGSASFERMIYGQYAWISSMLEFSNDHADEMVKVTQKADKETVQAVKKSAASGELRNWIDGEYQSWGKIDILAYRDAFPVAPREYKPGTSVHARVVPEGAPQIVRGVQDLTKPVGTRDAWVPRAYIFGPELKFLADKLKNQGLDIKVLEEPVSVAGEEFVIDKMRKDLRSRYPMTSLDGAFAKTARRDFPAGSYWLDMAQPRANAAFYFLEPQARDGMVAWWVFDDVLRELGVEERSIVYPIFKVSKKVDSDKD